MWSSTWPPEWGASAQTWERPADLYLDNLLMGTNVIEQCRLAGTDQLVVVGTICSYPKYTKVPFSEDSLWTGYPEETNAPTGWPSWPSSCNSRPTATSTGSRAST